MSRLRVRIAWKIDDGRAGTFVTDDSLDLHDDPEYESPFVGMPKGWNTFIWEEGNFACDCNRANFFLNETGWQCGERIEILSMTPHDALRED